MMNGSGSLQAGALYRQLERSKRAVERDDAAVKRTIAQGAQQVHDLAQAFTTQFEDSWAGRLSAQMALLRRLSDLLTDPSSLASANVSA